MTARWRNRGVIFALAAVACALVLLPRASTADTAAPAAYDAVHDFSIAKNPNGAWSYLTGAALLGHPQDPCRDVFDTICWWNGGADCDSALIGKNSAAYFISWDSIQSPPSHLFVDPRSAATAIVRWTAPADGTYAIKGDFLAIDSSESSHAVAILANAKPIHSATLAKPDQKDAFDLTNKLAKGDALEFVISTGAECRHLATGLAATISRT